MWIGKTNNSSTNDSDNFWGIYWYIRKHQNGDWEVKVAKEKEKEDVLPEELFDI